jgi:hypothetical protein
MPRNEETHFYSSSWRSSTFGSKHFSTTTSYVLFYTTTFLDNSRCNSQQNEQIKLIEQTKVAKKRSGTAPFIKLFPAYVTRVESQLAGADGLEIRASVDAGYDRIVTKMFDLLRQMAKLDGSEGEDKGQMNYHVILIGGYNPRNEGSGTHG